MLYTPIVLYSNGEPLDEITLNRALHDIQVNLEQAITNIEDVLNATSEAVPFSLVRRDAAGQSKFGTPTDEQHVIRVAEFRVLDEYVKDLINQTTQNVKRSRLPWASLSDRGIVQLNNSTNSTIQDQAATPYAVKKAYDKASSAQSSATAAMNAIPDVIDSVTSTDADNAGSANAVRMAYERADDLWQFFYDNHDFIMNPSSSPNTVGHGWYEFPNGLIIQYGEAVTPIGGTGEVYMPRTFPVGRWTVSVNESHGGGWLQGTNVHPTVYGIDHHTGGPGGNNGSFTIYGARLYSDGTAKYAGYICYFWIAIGH